MKANNNFSQKAKKSFAWDFFGTLIRQLSSLVVSIILARLLEPEEFGLVGMAMVFISISSVFVDVGFTDGVVQKKEISQKALSSIFFVNVALSIVTGCIIYYSAHHIGAFYKSTDITEIVQLLSLVLPITAISKVQEALLMKKLDFKTLNICIVSGTLVGGGVGIFLAFHEYGAYSLVWQQIVSAFIGSGLLWISNKWRPFFVFSWKEISSIIKFSIFVFFDQLVQQVFRKLDTLFIGKVFSPAILGFYTRAESLNAQVTTYTSASLRKVIFPVLSTIQDDEEKFKNTYFSVFNIVGVVISFIAGLLYFMADKIIIVLLGEKWYPSIIIFQILVFRLISSYGGLMTKALLSKGYSKQKFRISIVQRLIMLLPLVVGFYYGIEEFALAVVIAGLFYFVYFSYMIKYYLNLSFWYHLRLALLPWLTLIVIIVCNYLFFSIENSYVLTITFIFSQVLFLKAIKDQGFIVVKNEGLLLLKKLLRRLGQRV